MVAIFYVPIFIGLLIIPIDELIFFRGVAQPPTRDNNHFISLGDPGNSRGSHYQDAASYRPWTEAGTVHENDTWFDREGSPARDN